MDTEFLPLEVGSADFLAALHGKFGYLVPTLSKGAQISQTCTLVAHSIQISSHHAQEVRKGCSYLKISPFTLTTGIFFFFCDT